MIDYQKEINALNNLDVLALTIYGEARGECIEGQIAVGNVIRNRVNSEHKTFKEICLAPQQFSCWNINDPNYIILGEAAAKLNMNYSIDSIFTQILWIAQGILRNQIKDNIKNAENYLATYLFHSDKCPRWANAAIATTEIGNHTFIRV